MGTDIFVSLRREKILPILLNYFLLNCHRNLWTDSIPGCHTEAPIHSWD